ncbi:MAG TPA: purine-nucleoside phosphorylase [Candidatus Binatia bacterium]|nr:purine-nucleoside phosphorylase [Candidatus Binatia bacterium]
MRRKHVRAAGALLRERAGGKIDCAIVLGTGLGEALSTKIAVDPLPYAKIVGMPSKMVFGQPGMALIGMMQARRVVAFAGRFHLYQGYDPEDVVAPVEIAAEAGARTIVLTNAAGALNGDYTPGDFMFIADHVNLLGANPLAATSRARRGEAFVDLLDAYAPLLRERAQAIASGQGLRTHVGTYAAVLGPSFETPAEARVLRMLGADAVGMSTVLETIAARALGLTVLGISLITNIVGSPNSTHADVVAIGRANAGRFTDLLDGVVATLEGR